MVSRGSLRFEAGDRSVVHDLALLVAPARVPDLVRLELRRFADDDAVDEAERIGAGDLVFVERRDVDEGRCLADRVVLDVGRVGVGARGEVAAPFAPLHLAVERGRARVERGPDAHGGGF